jgi:ABC-type transport system involved in multi-copper enzyme maturation permease subunit
MPFDEGVPMSVMPVFTRELLVAGRKQSMQWSRAWVVAILVAIVLGTFGFQCYWAHGAVTHHLLTRVAQRAFAIAAAFHALLSFTTAMRAAFAIGEEKDRRTLDFLLTTRLANAEIVLGKLASCLIIFFGAIAAGLPVMILLVGVGGVDYRLLLVVYGCAASMGFFLAALALWVASWTREARRATASAALCTIGWLVGPILVSFLFPRFGIRLPHWVLTANAWVFASNPVDLLMKFAAGVGPTVFLSSIVHMIGLQVLGGLVFLTWAIVWLRWAYRVNVSGGGRRLRSTRRLFERRIRNRPAVGDDPILWRVMYTSRANWLERAIGFVIGLGALVALAWGTYYFAKPAVIEVWKHGFRSGVTTRHAPEMNLFIRLFVPAGSASGMVDEARTEFNLFLRNVSSLLTFMSGVFAMGLAAEIVATERRRETLDSLLATPLTGRDIAIAQLRSALWGLRWLFGTLFVLWTLGLFTGSVHPLGYIVAIFNVAASTWCFVALGTFVSVRRSRSAFGEHLSKDFAGALPAFIVFAFYGSLVLPWLIPAHFSSVLLGAGSTPFVTWLSLVSYRDVAAALRYPYYPPLEWMGIRTGEGVARVIATCLIGIALPAFSGLRAWQSAIANFDRRVGRPWREEAASADRAGAKPVVATS